MTDALDPKALAAARAAHSAQYPLDGTEAGIRTYIDTLAAEQAAPVAVEPVDVSCEDCGEPYASPRFQDLFIENEAFAKIASDPPYGGLFCQNCICARLHKAGLSNVQGRFTSGPLATPPAEVAEPDEYERQEKVCFARAMDQWRASLKRADLSDEDRVKGALAAYQRQAFAFHIRSALATPPAAQVAELERERDRWKFRGDNHWETLKSIREMARVGECDRIIQWVNDAGTGYTDSADATLASLQARATAAEAQAAKMREALEPIKAGIDASIWHDISGEKMKRVLVAQTAIDRIAAALASPAQEPQDAK